MGKEKLQDKLVRLADELASSIYAKTHDFPKFEQYALADQIRRAIISVPTNIIEGLERESDREKRRFMFIAKSSLVEVMYEVQFASRQQYIKSSVSRDFQQKGWRLARLLGAFIKTLASG